MFSNLGIFLFVLADSAAIFSLEKGQWDGSTAIFPYSMATW